MADINLKGMGVALITPFKEDESVDYEALGKLVDYQVQNGTDYPLGEKLMSLWNDKEMTLNPYDKKPCTFEGYYDKLIGQIGNDGSTFQSASGALTGALSSIDNQRQQTMGVSSDEELTHMIKFQSAYNASSRFMTVISQMTELIVTGLK